jgi:hypothetical protein
VRPADDSRYYRLWQVAGASHVSKMGNDYLLATENRENAGQAVSWDEQVEGSYDGSGNPDCPSTIGLGPSDKFPQRTTLDAAIAALGRWVATGRAPRRAPRIEVDDHGLIVRDEHSNAVGGVRNPAVDVPIAAYHGDEGCPLVGVTAGFNAAAMGDLYASGSDYVSRFTAAAARASKAGWLLQYDAADLVRRAKASAAAA